MPQPVTSTTAQSVLASGAQVVPPLPLAVLAATTQSARSLSTSTAAPMARLAQVVAATSPLSLLAALIAMPMSGAARVRLRQRSVMLPSSIAHLEHSCLRTVLLANTSMARSPLARTVLKVVTVLAMATRKSALLATTLLEMVVMRTARLIQKVSPSRPMESFQVPLLLQANGHLKETSRKETAPMATHAQEVSRLLALLVSTALLALQVAQPLLVWSRMRVASGIPSLAHLASTVLQDRLPRISLLVITQSKAQTQMRKMLVMRATTAQLAQVAHTQRDAQLVNGPSLHLILALALTVKLASSADKT